MAMNLDVVRERVERDGYITTDAVLASEEIAVITADLAVAQAAAPRRTGVRNLLASHPMVRRLAADGPLSDLATAVLGHATGAVRAILFDKTIEATGKSSGTRI